MTTKTPKTEPKDNKELSLEAQIKNLIPIVESLSLAKFTMIMESNSIVVNLRSSSSNPISKSFNNGSLENVRDWLREQILLFASGSTDKIVENIKELKANYESALSARRAELKTQRQLNKTLLEQHGIVVPSNDEDSVLESKP